jgi:hypothetical protein
LAGAGVCRRHETRFWHNLSEYSFQIE